MQTVWEYQCGLMRTDFTPKPAYAAFKSYVPGAPASASSASVSNRLGDVQRP